MSEEWLTPEEASIILGRTKASLRYRTRRGDLVPEKLPSSHGGMGYELRYRRSDVENLRDNWIPKGIPDYDRTPSVAECAYLAGLIDGEGSIIIHQKRKRFYHIHVSIVNSYEPVLDWVDERFGSSNRQRVQRGHRDRDRLMVWAWTVRSHLAYHILRITLPYLVIKREQALIAVAFQEVLTAQDNGRWRPLTDEDLAWRESERQRLSRLNHSRYLHLPPG